jgi:hypothetical protein
MGILGAVTKQNDRRRAGMLGVIKIRSRRSDQAAAFRAAFLYVPCILQLCLAAKRYCVPHTNARLKKMPVVVVSLTGLHFPHH